MVFLALIDLSVHAVLRHAEASGRLGSLVAFFEYGRSVPGKLARWQDNPTLRGNLFDVSWRSAILDESVSKFADGSADNSPTIRSYGMSFVNNIIKRAVEKRPGLISDSHAGPGAPPNFTYALFQDDRQNRRPGDIVVLGILSSSVPAMAALSNRTWVFEQPAPFTYPVYWPEGEGLRRVEPLINSADAQRALSDNPTLQAAWRDQLASEDLFHAYSTFGGRALDASPFLRLVRRSVGTSHVAKTEAEILAGTHYPYDTVLRRMVSEFARTAREEDQIPIVMLIQSRDPRDADILAITRPVLEAENIAYLATAEHFDPRDASGFLPDGHYRPRVDDLFADRFLDLIP
ncbi:hypothetical protein RA27_12535 [Ruegeria sp. ANG-R]|nr:hypothetical protein RA27_12535 [Ruegeria sp. ANG-R]